MDLISGLFNLSSGSVRDLAKNLFSGFYDRGLSANQALQELRDAGLGYRRQDFLSDFREGRGEFDRYTSVRYVNEDKTPSEGILDPKYHGTPDKYSFVFHYTGTDNQSGEDREGYFFYHRSSLDTRRNMEDEAEEWLDSKADKYGVSVDTIQLYEGYINPTWG